MIIDLAGTGEIKEIFAYISIDKHKKSGICGGITQLGLTALVANTKKGILKFEEMAQKLQFESEEGTNIYLIRYELAEIITSINKKNEG